MFAAGYRYARSLAGDPVLAEDLLQDGWLSLLRADGPRETGYLFRCIRSRFVDRHRRARLVAIDPLPLDELDALAGPGHAADVERLIDARSDRVAAALAALRVEEREVLFLHAVEGYTATEIGALVERPRGTVLSLLHRARAKLRGRLQSEEVAG